MSTVCQCGHEQRMHYRDEGCCNHETAPRIDGVPTFCPCREFKPTMSNIEINEKEAHQRNMAQNRPQSSNGFADLIRQQQAEIEKLNLSHARTLEALKNLLDASLKPGEHFEKLYEARADALEDLQINGVV